MKKKKAVKVIYECGCKQIIPEHGLNSGDRCPEHRQQQTNEISREYPSKTDVIGFP